MLYINPNYYSWAPNPCVYINITGICAATITIRYEIFCPFYDAHPVNPRARKSKPYFPGYVFFKIGVDEPDHSHLNWLPGVVKFVKFGSQFAVVPDRIILGICKRLQDLEIDDHSPSHFMKGDEVIVTEGAFAGFEGIFDFRISGSERSRILLKKQERQVE